jgi:hypothetical protein
VTDILAPVRACVDQHKLQAQINEAFATFLRDTGTSALDYSERDRLMWQLACASGYRIGLKIAQAMVDEEKARLLETQS